MARGSRMANIRDEFVRYGRAAMRRLVSRRRMFRGRCRPDGAVTLVVVDWHTEENTRRLVRSFRRFVSPTAPVVVVQNDSLRRSPYAGLDVRAVGPGFNLHHGLGLDWGLRFAHTEYVLVCDPDSIICDEGFWPRMRSLVDEFEVASIDNGATQYHPICLAFRLELWKSGVWSMEQDWSRDLDVAGALTPLLGFEEEALLSRSRKAGPPIESRRPGKMHFIGEVYEDLFSNTYGASRVQESDDAVLAGWSYSDTLAYHGRWGAWADGIVAGSTTLAEFPD
jgi:hypothetical protein